MGNLVAEAVIVKRDRCASAFSEASCKQGDAIASQVQVRYIHITSYDNQTWHKVINLAVRLSKNSIMTVQLSKRCQPCIVPHMQTTQSTKHAPSCTRYDLHHDMHGGL